MTTLARDGYDLVIGVGFAQGDAIGKVAQRFPDTNFAIIDVDQAFVPGKPATSRACSSARRRSAISSATSPALAGEAARRART